MIIDPCEDCRKYNEQLRLYAQELENLIKSPFPCYSEVVLVLYKMKEVYESMLKEKSYGIEECCKNCDKKISVYDKERIRDLIEHLETLIKIGEIRKIESSIFRN